MTHFKPGEEHLKTLWVSVLKAAEKAAVKRLQWAHKAEWEQLFIGEIQKMQPKHPELPPELFNMKLLYPEEGAQ